MPKSVPTPKTGTGWLWLACAAFTGYILVLNGGNTRTEFASGFNEGYSDTCAPFFAAAPGEGPSALSPGCDSDGNAYVGVGGATAEVAQP